MDLTKKAIAQHIQRLTLGTNWNYIVKPISDRTNEASALGDLRTLISIRTPNGPRHFIVTIKEEY